MANQYLAAARASGKAEELHCVSADELVRPRTLRFPCVPNKASVQSLLLSFRGAAPLAFKVKTSNPRRYACHPTKAVLLPGAPQSFSVKLRPTAIKLSDCRDCQDRFKIFFFALRGVQVISRVRPCVRIALMMSMRGPSQHLPLCEAEGRATDRLAIGQCGVRAKPSVG